MPNLPENQHASRTEKIQNYIKDLTHYSTSVREIAKRQLQLHGADAIEMLLDEYNNEFQKYNRNKLHFDKLGKKGIKIGLVLGLVPLLFQSTDPYGAFTLSWLFMIALMIGISLFLRMHGAKMPARLGELYTILVQLCDPRIFSVILEMYDTSSDGYLENTLDLLTGYLPQVTPSQWEGLNAKQRGALYHLVESRGQISTKRCYDFTLAALTALEQFGDMEAIPAVQHVAKHGSNAGLRGAAVNCLPYLEMRRDEQSVRQTLLRASQSTGGSDQLLRVPTYAPDTESEQLLRMPQE